MSALAQAPDAAARAAGYFQRAQEAVRAADAGVVAIPQAAVTQPRQHADVAVRSRIPGDQLLGLIRDKWFGRYARFPSPAALDAVTLWAAHAHMRDEAGVLVFRATPRLFLLSSEPGSGKSRVLELIGMISPACFGLDLEPTPAGLA
ncbi:MAG TPA: hypothetical protein VLW53_12950, partial [Candidatus Eisenbacteria bacterium]|nr:hypothetical protein [Candidatus Eisenbacteria bacterium]